MQPNKTVSVLPSGKKVLFPDKKPVAKQVKSSTLTNAAGLNSLITFTVLLLAWISGFASRLFAVIRFESIIHEFDPWYD
jgi:dolichyl-diphosphooligosaccharide--protein glycosyltransferase